MAQVELLQAALQGHRLKDTQKERTAHCGPLFSFSLSASSPGKFFIGFPRCRSGPPPGEKAGCCGCAAAGQTSGPAAGPAGSRRHFRSPVSHIPEAGPSDRAGRWSWRQRRPQWPGTGRKPESLHRRFPEGSPSRPIARGDPAPPESDNPSPADGVSFRWSC